MKFASPEFFKWLLLILPLVAIVIFMHRRRTIRLAQLISSKVWETVIPGHKPKRNRRCTILRLLALFCIGIALTRPQWGSYWEKIQHRSLDILVVLDTSKSMLATDIKPNRLQQAKWAVRDFVKHLKGDRIGLIAFAGSSFLQCPITIDYAAFTMMLNDLYAGIIPRGGTAIAQALKTAEESFDKDSEADRVIILITDGENHVGDPLHIAKQLREKDIRLFSIGVGTATGELIPAGNGRGYLKNEMGQVVKSTLNETLLEQLASETGGFYVRSVPGDFGLEQIYKRGIANLQRDEQETRLAKVYKERFGWFAGIAFLFLLLEGRPRRRKGFGSKILLISCILLSPKIEAANWEKAYKAGDYTNALKGLESLIKKFPDIGNYNHGDVLYRQKHFQDSEKAFAEAAAQTKNEKLKQKAIYNRGTALLRGAHNALQNPETVDEAFAMAEQSVDLFEDALLLKPDDLTAKKNLERALNLIVHGRLKQTTKLIRDADQMLTEYKAKAAKENYLAAKKALKLVFDNFSPENEQANLLTQQADKQLQILKNALKEAKNDLKTVQLAIDAYQYKTAADLMIEDKPTRRWAFNLDPKLSEQFQQLTQNNINIINIIYP